MCTLFDMHCHLDFAEDAERIACASRDAGICALSCTVVPSSYVSDLEKFAECDNVALSLGLHPWWVADGRVSEVDIARFESLLFDAFYVGEIGLDFSGRHKATKTHQLAVFERLIQDIHAAGDNRVITFHAVQAQTPLLDMLERFNTTQHNTCLFHWFSGSHEEFGRAVATGAFFSVGLRMLATPKGQLYAKGVPADQLLIETDNPPHEGSSWSVDVWAHELQNTIAALAEVRNVSSEEIMSCIEANARRIIQL